MITDRLSQAIVALHERLLSWEHDVAREKGLTVPQTHTLGCLAMHGPLPMKQLASYMGTTTGTVTVLIDRLEAKGFVERHPNERDKRSTLVSLTALGQDLYEGHARRHREMTAKLMAPLAPDQRAALLDYLETITRPV